MDFISAEILPLAPCPLPPAAGRSRASVTASMDSFVSYGTGPDALHAGPYTDDL